MPQVSGLDVSRETIARLEGFAALVAKWTPRINLIAKGTVDAIWDPVFNPEGDKILLRTIRDGIYTRSVLLVEDILR